MANSHASTTNPCKMCRPLGACLVFSGVENSMVLLHGSQGCSTYMRRYISGHYNEPVDIASSSLSEQGAIYGGEANLKQGIRNVVAKYSPSVLCVATTCLTETIGDNVKMIIDDLLEEEPGLRDVKIIPVSTPSYSGSHTDGFYDSCVAILDRFARGGEDNGAVNLFPGFLSPADIRYLREVMDDCQVESMILPDCSGTLDAGIGDTFYRIPRGGTRFEDIERAGSSSCSIEFNLAGDANQSSARLLDDRFGVRGYRLPLPIGIRNSDLLFNTLSEVTAGPTPQKYQDERSRLLDAMVDAHKYLFGQRAVIYGDAEFVIAMTSFLVDAGIFPVVCASGGGNARYVAEIETITGSLDTPPAILREADFDDIYDHTLAAGADLLIGNSKGNHIARRINVPLVRVGYPIHDRIGAQRILHTGYRGAMNLLDILTNTIIARKQDDLGYGYSYM